jgi:hypothetical protein
MDSLFPAFREGMSVPSLRAKMSKILLGYFCPPPKDANILPRNVVTTQTRRATKQNIAKPELQRGETRHSRYDNEYVYGLSSNRRYETVQNQNNHLPHIFLFMHNPRNSLELCDSFGSPYTAERSNTYYVQYRHTSDNKNSLYAKFAERISRATGTVQRSPDTE